MQNVSHLGNRDFGSCHGRALFVDVITCKVRRLPDRYTPNFESIHQVGNLTGASSNFLDDPHKLCDTFDILLVWRGEENLLEKFIVAQIRKGIYLDTK